MNTAYYHTQPQQQTQYGSPTYFQVRPAIGGWIVTHGGIEHVITKPEQLLKFMEPKKDAK